ncbi:MAG: hypothetical protein H7222_11515 [Methylotenera sp.]|nr:hypothetical protein [Oligoflexia bacterium]
MKYSAIAAMILAFGLVTGCASKDETSTSDNTETAQQVGDQMASVDESSGTSSGAVAFHEMNASERMFARVAPREIHDSWLQGAFGSNAYAATCASLDGFGTCSSSSKTRTFSGCTVGAAIFNGTVGFAWSGGTGSASCQLAGSGASVTRTPNLTVTGRRGATLTVSSTSGQMLTYGGAGTGSTRTFQFSSGAVRRVFKLASGATLMDHTSSTTAPITVMGDSRATRVLNGGTMHVVNNTTGVSCDYSPTNVAWTSGCNCATSGSWAGTCSNGTNTSLVLNGCGTASLTTGSTTESVAFDRCGT